MKRTVTIICMAACLLACGEKRKTEDGEHLTKTSESPELPKGELAALETAYRIYQQLLPKSQQLKAEVDDLDREFNQVDAEVKDTESTEASLNQILTSGSGANDIAPFIPLIKDIARSAAANDSSECQKLVGALSDKIETTVNPWSVDVRDESDKLFMQSHYRADSDSQCLGEIESRRFSNLGSMAPSDQCNLSEMKSIRAEPQLPISDYVKGHIRSAGNVKEACVDQATATGAIGEAGKRFAVLEENIRTAAVAAAMHNISLVRKLEMQDLAAKLETKRAEASETENHLLSLKSNRDRYVSIMALREQRAREEERKNLPAAVAKMTDQEKDECSIKVAMTVRVYANLAPVIGVERASDKAVTDLHGKVSEKCLLYARQSGLL